MFGRAALSLLAATAAEVSGLAYWYEFLKQERYFAAYASLVAGESVEFLLLAILIITAADAYPCRNGRVGTVLIQTGLVLFSESILWFLWIYLIATSGLIFAIAVLFVLMHLKHTAAVSFFHGRQIREDIFDLKGVTATVLEVGGASAFYILAVSGWPVVGVVVLALSIGVEHSLQFSAAGVAGDRVRGALHS